MKTKVIITMFLSALLNAAAALGQSRQYVAVENHDSLTVYYPDYKRIDLVTGKMPSKTDKKVIFCCAAAFTGERLPEFKHSNIAGHHVGSGEFHTGFKCGTNNGIFTWSKSAGARFYNFSHKNSEAPLKAAAAGGGMGFCQSLLFYNGRQFKGCFKPYRWNRYRALCEINGRICIVDCSRNLSFGSFLDGLKKLGVRNAIYCDMGYGWNYSWYRKPGGSVVELFPTPGKWTTNWIAFYTD